MYILKTPPKPRVIEERITIYPDSYEGFLSPYIDQIINLYYYDKRSYAEIARIISSLIEIDNEGDYVSPTMIRYVLMCIGQFHPVRACPRLQRLINESHEYIAIPVKINKGRPIDMGGPRDVWIEDELWNLK